ncbi:hypothetical protein EI42_00283 [Thermosporothrix hazakensis]|jgi:hypothetical protein|uniref:Uncharacterized protein n=1 Tax=Thermosporothrix hazakensis TaxID=644383 RepID=A0A326UU08_THEHA|nr:hypothetical protein [Thermosporothrix hazakensis]PZW36113.1 hypothetical protein EI42_00283 [Thermosporothrix hazakensis]GCE46764.1 hypothetical protein KTH_16330 [Thermosporothrix hazakensis]
MPKVNRTIREGRQLHKVVASRRCRECEEEALGRCPDCNLSFCQEHFPKQHHSPCAERQMRLAQEQICYVCGIQVYPDQWSISHTSHFVDNFFCRGCGRHICDELHTQRKSEDVTIIRDGMRGHRYQYVNRYCDLCSPLHFVGGLKGLARTLVALGTVAAAVFFYFHP